MFTLLAVLIILGVVVMGCALLVTRAERWPDWTDENRGPQR